MKALLEGIAIFTLAYPSLMAMVWVCGGLYYYFQWERRDIALAKRGLELPYYPKVTLMVPCYNEGANVEETIGHLLRQRYPDFEVLAINDGSKDDTGARLDRLAQQDPRLTVLHQHNQGKAMALNNGLTVASGEILVGIDGDAVLDYDAVRWMVKHFIESPRVGAVTGNPRVRTRSTIIGKIQTGEFSSIIGLIKRAQRIYGTVFTVSGVVVAFRKQAVEAVGGWSNDMVTEDIDISWKLQLAGWLIHYQPQALCWVLMPETVRGLYKQRLRWAQGGAEVFLRYGLQAMRWRNRRFWLLLLEYLSSVAWCYSMLLLALIWLIEPDVSGLAVGHLFQWSGVMMTAICLVQFGVSIFIDNHYDKSMARSFIWCVWYPLIYWLLNLVTVVVAVPKAILRRRGQLAVWESPDRGSRSVTKHKLAKEMIISNGARRSWKYRLRDLLILLVTWVGWVFLALQPWLNYLEAEEDESFIGSLDAIEVGQLFLALLFGIFLLIHSWAKYNRLLHRLVGKRTASKAP